jgi:hypothetical protein
MVVSKKRLIENARRLTTNADKMQNYENSFQFTYKFILKLIKQNERLERINYQTKNGTYRENNKNLEIILSNLKERCELIRPILEREERYAERICKTKIETYNFLITRVIKNSFPFLNRTYLPCTHSQSNINQK